MTPNGEARADLPPAVFDPQAAIAAARRDGVRLVTFDVFDTLLWRATLFPHDAFHLLEGAVLRRARRHAERVVTAFHRRVLRREPRLADIYRLLPGDAAPEIEIEARLARANPLCLAALRALVDEGVPVAAVSDMYLAADEIGLLLARAGYPDIPVFSSATEHLTKASGGLLYPRVWTRLGVAADAVLHVGDNPHADGAMARLQGARACLVRTPRAALLERLPGLGHGRRDAATAAYWGELAVHLYLAEAARGAPATTVLRGALEDLARAARSGQPVPLDTARARLDRCWSKGAS